MKTVFTILFGILVFVTLTTNSNLVHSEEIKEFSSAKVESSSTTDSILSDKNQCTPSFTVAQYFLNSNTAFIGEAIDIQKSVRGSSLEIKFNVEKIWKGDPVDQISVKADNPFGGCEFPFILLGEKYLVFTYGDDDTLLTNTMWTKSLASAKDDIALLDDPKFQLESKTREDLLEKIQDSDDVLLHTIWSLNDDSFLTKNYVRENSPFLDKIISNCDKHVRPIHDFRISSIFYGEVLDIKNGTGPFEKIVTLDVDKKWHGDISDSTQVVTDTEECGNAFELNKKFLVFTVGDDPMFAPFYFVSPPPGEIPEGPRSSAYDVEGTIGYIERVHIQTGEFEQILKLRPQTEHAYNVLKAWESENNATVTFGSWFVADGTNALVKLDKDQIALVVSLSAQSNPSISKEDLVLLLQDMFGDIPIHFGGYTYFIRESSSNENLQTVLAPHKQLKNGTLLEDIICKDGLELIFKFTNNSPACVSQLTAQKLLERGYYHYS